MATLTSDQFFIKPNFTSNSYLASKYNLAEMRTVSNRFFLRNVEIKNTSDNTSKRVDVIFNITDLEKIADASENLKALPCPPYCPKDNPDKGPVVNTDELTYQRNNYKLLYTIPTNINKGGYNSSDIEEIEKQIDYKGLLELTIIKASDGTESKALIGLNTEGRVMDTRDNKGQYHLVALKENAYNLND